MATGPDGVVAAADGAVAALTAVLEPSRVAGSRAQWAGVVASLQRVVDVASAVQDAAIVRLAAIEPEFLEDGTDVEGHRGLGHVALDAPAILSGVLAVSSVHPERRVAAAVALAADGPEGTATESGLGGLHEAMGAGRLDGYRAGVVAQELGAAPPQVRATVVAVLQGHFELEDAAHLRRRCRRALARISPDLLRQRALRARASCGLRRWVDEPGVDRWEGTFPSEDAAKAWAAIDALARRYVADGACPGIEGARGKALTDLVAGNATIDTVLTLTVPASAVVPAAVSSGAVAEPSDEIPDAGAAAGAPVAAADAELVEVTGPAGNQPVLVSRAWVTQLAEVGTGPGSGASTVEVVPCHPATGALLDAGTEVSCGVPNRDAGRCTGNFDTAVSAGLNEPRERTTPVATAPYRPSAALARLVRARDRRCRFPGCTVAAVFCDLDHVRPWPAGPTTDTNLACLCRRHHRVKQRPGWHVTLATDGDLIWTDPTGRARTTHPADALTSTVLTGAPLPPTARGGNGRTRTDLPDEPHSNLEFRLEHRGAPVPAEPRRRAGAHHRWRDDRGRLHRVELMPSTAGVTVDPDGDWPSRRVRSAWRHCDHDPPPF